MPFIPDPLAPRYAHATPGEMNEFEPCDCGSNNLDCPKCRGTGVIPHQFDLKIEGLDSPSSNHLDDISRITRSIRENHEIISDVVSKLQERVERMRDVNDMDERIKKPMAQEEVDAQYRGTPEWLEKNRSHLGSWDKRYANED